MGRHVLRNAGIPVVTVLGTRLAQLLGGTVVVETVFGVPGLGSLTAVVLVINFLVDRSYGLIDPRTAVRS